MQSGAATNQLSTSGSEGVNMVLHVQRGAEHRHRRMGYANSASLELPNQTKPHQKGVSERDLRKPGENHFMSASGLLNLLSRELTF